MDALLCLGLGVDAPSHVGAVVPRLIGQRRARASRKRASVALCDGGCKTRRRLLRQGRPLAFLFRVRLNMETQKKTVTHESNADDVDDVDDVVVDVVD